MPPPPLWAAHSGKDPERQIFLNIVSFFCHLLLSAPDPRVFPGAPRILS